MQSIRPSSFDGFQPRSLPTPVSQNAPVSQVSPSPQESQQLAEDFRPSQVPLSVSAHHLLSGPPDLPAQGSPSPSDPARPSEVEDSVTPVLSSDPIRSKDPHIVVSRDGEPISVANWPTSPERLRRPTYWGILFTAGGTILTFAPVAFLVLAALAAQLHNEPTGSRLGKNAETFTQLGPTIFPILFAAIAGQALKNAARYVAEGGAQLGTLELLMASQTVWGTFESQVLLRKLTAVGAHLFILWALSPIGGQASLRILGKSTATITNTSSLAYLPTGMMNVQQYDSSSFATGSGSANGGQAANTLYNAALLAPATDKSGPQDIWGNIRIPWIEQLNGSTADSNGWMAISAADMKSPDNFTSLVGLPVVGLPSTANASSFSMQSAYLSLDCTEQYNASYDASWWRTHLGVVWNSTGGNGTFQQPYEDPFVFTSFYLDSVSPQMEKRVDALLSNQTASNSTDPDFHYKRNVMFGTWDEYATSVYIRNCSVSQTYVESYVNCTRGACAVTKMRPSVEYGALNPNLTVLEQTTQLYNMFRQMSFSLDQGHPGDVQPTTLYIQGLPAPYVSYGQTLPNTILDIPYDTFNVRLGSLMNTYWQLGISPQSFTGDLGPPEKYLSDNSTDILVQGLFNGVPASATVFTYYEIYVCNYVWLAVLIACSVVLLLTGIVGSVLKALCRSPEMMGYVASMTYDNPFMKLPPGGSALGAMERARLLRRVRVRVGDVEKNNDVGHVAFACIEDSVPKDTNDTVGKLRRDKTYL
ncbi:MAG: hypothetical protein Q9165_000634 [Trypethelium subeluteriae]